MGRRMACKRGDAAATEGAAGRVLRLQLYYELRDSEMLEVTETIGQFYQD